MSYFECHVTMTGDPSVVRPAVEELHWKFSTIDGDPVLGAGVKCYATRMFPSTMFRTEVFNKLLKASKELAAKGITVLRKKIELVIYDDRSESCEMDCGNCQEAR